MRTLLDFSAWITFPLFMIYGTMLFLISLFALRYFHRQARLDANTIPSPAFLGTIATAWALSLGFVAADAWSVNARAEYAAKKERSAISRLLDTANPLVLNNEPLHAAIIDYRKNVADIEWTRDDNTKAAPEVELAILNIRAVIQKIAESGVPGSTASQLVSDFDELQDSRNERLAIASTSVDDYKWYLLLFLTLLTATTIAAIHADRPIAGRRALTLFAITASISLWILSTHADPYVGAGALESSLLFKQQG